MITRFTVMLLVIALIVLALPAPGPARAAPLGNQPGMFGLNMYITGQERSDEQARALIDMGRRIGVGWTREEISWAAWGNAYYNGHFDERIGWLDAAGFEIIGMLLTTPERYRDPACEAYAHETNQPAYWCAPTDPDAFARWAGRIVERYDGDGIDDAPGSPRVAAWEIWNEPDQDGTWLPKADPAAYAVLLRKSYDAIKAADPSALVLNGGVMTFDSIGVNGFMSQVVEIAGWDSFDVLSLHPWLIDYAPDDPRLINPRENYDITIPGRIAMARRWIAERGGGKPIWISEVGWSVCGNACAPQFAKSEEQQANYMVRTFILAAATGVEHVSYFQLEDKFQGAQIPWSQAAIVRDDLSPRPAYLAYGTMVAQLQFAEYAGTGPLHRPNVLANHRFALPGGGNVDVLWSLAGPQQVSFPLSSGLNASLVDLDGTSSVLAGGRALLSVGERPLYVRQSPDRLHTFSETGFSVQGAFLNYWESRGGLALFGYPLGPERIERQPDGSELRVQWFERNRFEYHPGNPPDSQVLLGRLGVEALQRRGIDWRTLPQVAGAGEGCLFFGETGHSLCPPFRAAWEAGGGLAIFGYPISEPMPEAVENGAPVTVQYFERNRFEHHPENPPGSQVLLGRLGAELMP